MEDPPEWVDAAKAGAFVRVLTSSSCAAAATIHQQSPGRKVAKRFFLVRPEVSRVLSQPPGQSWMVSRESASIFETRRCSTLPAAVMLTSACGQIAHPSRPRWKLSGVSHRARLFTCGPCFLAVWQRPPGFSLIHRPSFSSQHNQSTSGAAGNIMAERELTGKDKLVLRGLQFHGFHGVKQEEKTLGQKFVVDVDAWMDLSTAGETDNISDTVSYTDIYRIVKDVVEGPSQNLLESVAHRIASASLIQFSQISAVRVQVGKPHVAVQGIVDYLGVEIVRYRKDMGGNSSGASSS
ncbi:hypothetical protein EJB05_44010 [Eragrostis curvula]|uniref:7,8-dihydroneopterin aldolase n=1 Tax=Eragrostis curvula TaxID=38414 RepID=A0A5J9TGE2_9POAL|nr:hypothetical protein EJB05_55860 [Eragrostis curvula]TVU10476.1 hypothetical protein EJB05_44010 [Eragrostis curvula]